MIKEKLFKSELRKYAPKIIKCMSFLKAKLMETTIMEKLIFKMESMKEKQFTL